MDNLEDVKLFRKGNVYKIGWMNNRKDAKRHLLKVFQASNDEEAKDKFIEAMAQVAPDHPNKRFTLYTGNWKYIMDFER